MDIVKKFESLSSERKLNFTPIMQVCEKLGLKFLGMGMTRVAVLYEGECYKLAYDLDKHDNESEWEYAKLLKNTTCADFFALPVEKISPYIMKVEYVDGKRCLDIIKETERYDFAMSLSIEVRDQVAKETGLRICDIHDGNVMITSTNDVKIVDFAMT